MNNYLKADNIISGFLILGITYLSIFNYKYFGPFIIVIYLYLNYFNFEVKLNKFYKYYPLIFYFLKFLFNISEKFNYLHKSSIQLNYYEKARFLDLQNLFLEWFCNSDNNLDYVFNFDIQYLRSCPYQNYWGPLSSLIKTPGINIWNATLSTSAIILICLSCIYISEYKKLSHNHFLLFVLSISPPVNFLIDRMNIDIVIFLVSFLMIKNIENSLVLKLGIFSLFAQYKIHPIILIASICIYFLIKKNRKNFTISFIVFGLNIASIYQFYTNNTFYTARPFLSYRSFGILSDATFISKFLGSITVSYLIICLILILLVYLLIKKTVEAEIELDSVFFNFSLWFLGVSLYSNYDYRIPILIFIFLKLFSLQIKLLNLSLLIFVFLSPFPISETFINLKESNIFSANFIDITFYIIVGYIVKINYFTIKSRLKT